MSQIQNVFVVGTGRCGTVTFAKACKHITNFTTGHETPLNLNDPHFGFKPGHIEVSPHLTWILGPLLEAMDDRRLCIIHLKRDRAEVINSWIKRGQGKGPGLWTPLALRKPGLKMGAPGFKKAAGLCYDSMVAQIDAFLDEKETVTIADIKGGWWRKFWDWIGAEGDFDKSLKEWEVRHNAS